MKLLASQNKLLNIFLVSCEKEFLLSVLLRLLQLFFARLNLRAGFLDELLKKYLNYNYIWPRAKCRLLEQ